jgi:4-amino-4-deoxy-L-arabinose transferase-like glycosyltransferase
VRRRSDTPDRWPTGPAVTVVAVAAFVAAAVLLATASGLGVSPDGVAYLSLADETRTRGSPYALLAPSPTHYAPLWAILVGAISAVSGADDLLGIGRFLNALLAASIAVLVYLAARRSAAVPAWWATVAAAVAALSFALFRLSVRALTEPLFVALILATLLLVEVSVQRHSRRLVLSAAAMAAAVVLTRFAGIAIIFPVAVAAWRIAPDRLRRVLDVLAVALITVAPTAIWTLAAPNATATTHLGGGNRGGFAELGASFIEAGHVVLGSPSAKLAEPLYLLLGVMVLAAPFVGAAAVAARQSESEGGVGRSRLDRLDSSGLLPWLLFLVAYTALIAGQRWWIDREIIDRYWVPFVVVGVVVVARAVAESGLLLERRTRTFAVAVAALVIVVNLALVVTFTATRSTRGIELNEARYRDAALFVEAVSADVDAVLTDSVRLVELHLVALGDMDVDVRDVGCRRSGESNAVPMAMAATGPTAVILAGSCDREATMTALAAIAGSKVITDADVGTLVLIDGS